MDVSRRRLLGGRLLHSNSTADSSVIRPPWSKAEAHFIHSCQRCNACVEQCDTKVLVTGAGGYPEVDFSRGECSFCGHCVESCQHDAFSVAVDNVDIESAWSLLAVINQRCLSEKNIECRSCEDSCESRAIRFKAQLNRVSQPIVDNLLCNGCGACFSICPVSAIEMKSEHKKRERI